MSDALDRLARALEDRYRIERELGAGGMATVYLAEDRVGQGSGDRPGRSPLAVDEVTP